MINDFEASGLYYAIRRSCFGYDGQETMIKKMCDDFTKRSKVKQGLNDQPETRGKS